MTRAIGVRLWILILLILLALVGLLGFGLSTLDASRARGERDELNAQNYLLECARALETTRDNVTEKIAPLEGKTCEDSILTRAGLKKPEGVNSSQIKVDRTLEPYSPGEYTVTVFSSEGKVWSLSRGSRVTEVGSL